MSHPDFASHTALISPKATSQHVIECFAHGIIGAWGPGGDRLAMPADIKGLGEQHATCLNQRAEYGQSEPWSWKEEGDEGQEGGGTRHLTEHC